MRAHSLPATRFATSAETTTGVSETIVSAPVNGALKAAAKAPAAPQPTRMRMSERCSFSLLPNLEARPQATWVWPASSSTDTPKPWETRFWTATMRLSVSERRPPCNAFASMGSTRGRLRQRASPKSRSLSSAPPALGAARRRELSSTRVPSGEHLAQVGRQIYASPVQ